MNLGEYVLTVRPAIEDELKRSIDRVAGESYAILRHMLAYHMGWEGEGAGSEAQGKRIRPLLVLLCSSAGGADWRNALPAAAAVELLHNFSLIHDDIQDRSSERRGRPTVWTIWGIAQAINAGDLMFTLANQALLDLDGKIARAEVIQAASIFQQACANLTQGQYLDISYENRQEIGVDEYWQMIAGKTAALLSACCELGALVGNAPPQKRDAFRRYGNALGMAFQVLDDWLGIWGDPLKTGKSVESDLVTGKKTLPVLYGLSLGKEFAERWRAAPIRVEEVPQVTALLTLEGAERYTLEQADLLTREALNALREAQGGVDPQSALVELTGSLLRRER
jgi:geranylgeranyl diphosphate synthase, type I